MFCLPPHPHNGVMTGTAIALCAALNIDQPEGQVPEWVHLLPAGEVRTFDGRGPFRVTDAEAIMSRSMQGGKLVLDENHSTDLAAPRGESAPARGWIVELQSRADGIWGRVEWTPEGRNVVPGYRGISPAIAHLGDGTVTAVVRASLVNAPNLVGLVALHQKETVRMDFHKLLLEVLGLDSAADDAAIATAIEKFKAAQPAVPEEAAVALNAMTSIATMLGLDGKAGPQAVLAGVKQLKAGGDDEVTSLQSQVATLTVSLNQVEDDRKRDKAVAYVDGAIAAGRVGLRPARDEYISMHMENPARAEKLVSAMPILAPGKTTLHAEVKTGGADNPTLLAQKAKAYRTRLAATGVHIDFATAVRDVHEGKDA